MSMLAERRRKQKWAVDPRNTAWSNDDSKFGQRMLEKMGWSKGKGLGAQEQGATDHIKVQVKNNHLGLGATINNEDNWIAHQDDFNQLLAQLNTCHGQETADSPDNKEKKSFSLEEKSKISKNRVHYMKFTKGKDLSSRSQTDLDCIFGKRQKRTPEIPSQVDFHKPGRCAGNDLERRVRPTPARLPRRRLTPPPRPPVPSPSTSTLPGAWRSGRAKLKAWLQGRRLQRPQWKGKGGRKERKRQKIKMWKTTSNLRPRRRETKWNVSWGTLAGMRILELLLRLERVTWVHSTTRTPRQSPKKGKKRKRDQSKLRQQWIVS
ncbi:PIN2/TERF1-interacting telomerase inhibitor 1 isoform X1 [Bubalus bubalis]|uniref:PIN2/TERF1-interacting telomerase inhibitor 1 isoform X1 n=1 Tax=Bubalus bubalis TaxID=89462 RepID=UPI000DBC8F82|nr:PIN2/TERF1-interacting telomerase inhibitor 1 isoform X1 [Bubalus bubalis]